MKKFTVAVCQMLVGSDKRKNIEKAEDFIRRASENGAELVVLPEIFNSPYSNDSFPLYAETYPGETSLEMSKTAKELGIYLVAGSIPERDGERIYNTSYMFSPEGELVARHRKMHLFDIDIKGGQYFKESDVLSPGNQVTVADTSLGKIGMGICYDIRFPEYFRLLALEGVKVAVLPAAFNMTTGPAHWEMSVRMRALDNQIYMVAASPARDESSGYVSYANSRIADPWGKIIASAGTGEEIIYAKIDPGYVDEIREQLPLLKHRRSDIYRLEKADSEEY